MKILDILYKKSLDEKNEYIKYKILSGLIYFKYDNNSKTFDLRFLGIRIFYSKLKEYYKKYYFLFFLVFKIKATNEFLYDFLDNLTKKYRQYDDYYVFLSRSGEFFLLMHHLCEWIKNNNSENYLLVFAAKYHMNICKMFFPDINAIYIPKLNIPLISRGINSIKTIYKNKNIYVPTYEKYFVDVENKIRNNSSHYYELLKLHLNLSNETQSFKISCAVSEKVKNIAKYILNNNFIFISPETMSNEPLKKEFWENLCKQLKAMGFKIFCNTMDFHNLILDCESIFLTYEEAIELSKYAKAIIGMRSGFIECLSQNNIPLFVIYTNFPNRQGFKELSSDKVLNGYTIKKLPYVNHSKIFEYDFNKYKNQENIIDEITGKIININITLDDILEKNNV